MYRYKILKDCYYGEGKKHRHYKKGMTYSSKTLKPEKAPKYFELSNKGLQESINKKERELQREKLELASEVERKLRASIADKEKEIEDLKKALKEKPKSIKEEMCEMNYAQMQQFIKKNNIVVVNKNKKSFEEAIKKFKEDKKLEEKAEANGQKIVNPKTDETETPIVNNDE